MTGPTKRSTCSVRVWTRAPLITSRRRLWVNQEPAGETILPARTIMSWYRESRRTVRLWDFSGLPTTKRTGTGSKWWGWPTKAPTPSSRPHRQAWEMEPTSRFPALSSSIVRRDAADTPAVEKVVEFYLDHAPQLAREVGYIPLPAAGYAAGTDRFRLRTTGSAASKAPCGNRPVVRHSLPIRWFRRAEID